MAAKAMPAIERRLGTSAIDIVVFSEAHGRDWLT
jgi:hypothetical protein